MSEKGRRLQLAFRIAVQRKVDSEYKKVRIGMMSSKGK